MKKSENSILQSNEYNSWIKELSSDLMIAFPDMKGFSYRNLRAIKQWYLFYSNWQQAIANNFETTLQKTQSDLANELIKDEPTIGIL